MRIARIRIRNFRCIKSADILPAINNVLLGPNNEGKTTILEALNLILSPEFTYRSNVIDENDFHNRDYRTPCDSVQPAQGDETEPTAEGEVDLTPAAKAGNIVGDAAYNIYLEVVITNLSDDDKDVFGDHLVAWDDDAKKIIEACEEGQDPFERAMPAIRVFFEAWYDQDEDDFHYNTFFLPFEGAQRDDCRTFTRSHKRHVGFLIYRNFRALTRPITLEPNTLFGLLLASQESTPKRFEDVLDKMKGALSPIAEEQQFASILNSYRAELERFLPLNFNDPSHTAFELTDRTRKEIKAIAQLYVESDLGLPLQKMGAGTRSLSILSILTLIMRRRGRGILALEEPETFLFPHAQRRLIDECLDLADQQFITTHSPFVLERIPVDGVGRVRRDATDNIVWTQVSSDSVKDINLYSKRLKQVHCEALVGRAVVVVEGDSDRVWLIGASRLLNGKTWREGKQEAFELLGIGVVCADGHGDIAKLGRFFHSAGLLVIGLYDKLNDQAVVRAICDSEYPSIFLPYDGLEALLAHSLPITVLKRLVTTAPHCKTSLLSEAEVSNMADKAIRDFAETLLVDNKGSIQMHEWLIAETGYDGIPNILRNIVWLITEHVKQGIVMYTHSVIG